MTIVRLTLFCVLFSGASCVVAQSNSPDSGTHSAPATTAGLQIDTIAERRVVIASSDGPQVRFVPADQLQIGDEIFYTVRVRNVTSAPLSDAVVVKAMPRNTRYVDDSAVGPATTISVSIDGGATFSSPDDLEVATAPGFTRQATADDYTHVRWQFKHPLAPGAIALLRFRGVFR